MGRAARVNKLVTIEQQALRQDDFAHGDAEIETKQAYASITPLRGRELVDAQQVESSVTHRIMIRYSKNLNLSPMDNIKYQDRSFGVETAINVEERNIWYECMCRENV